MDFFWKETYEDIKREFKELCKLIQKKQLTKYRNSRQIEVYNEEDILAKIQSIIKNIKKVLRSKEIDDTKRNILINLQNDLKNKVLKTGYLQFAWASVTKGKL